MVLDFGALVTVVDGNLRLKLAGSEWRPSGLRVRAEIPPKIATVEDIALGATCTMSGSKTHLRLSGQRGGVRLSAGVPLSVRGRGSGCGRDTDRACAAGQVGVGGGVIEIILVVEVLDFGCPHARAIRDP